MWGTNSLSQRLQSNNKLSFEIGRNNTISSQPNITSNNNINEINLLYHTPIKQFHNIPNNNNCSVTPFRFDFNYYFGNMWSAGQIPTNQLIEPNMNLSPTQLNKENILFYKKSIEQSYKLSPISQMKNSTNSQNNSNNSLGNYNNDNVIALNQNNENIDNNIKISKIYNMNNNMFNELSKKNLSELFNNAKNEQFLYDSQKKKNEMNNINSCHKNINNNGGRIDIKNEIRKKNCNLQISHQFIFSSPRIIKKPKKIFECSGSTIATNSSLKTANKKRRFRKNNEQLKLLKNFYNEHKFWSKTQIKEISQNIGLKENKVYKWLWDQRNKEIKATKFVVKKGNSS